MSDLRERLEEHGVYVEPVDAGPVRQLVGSLAGSALGSALGNAARLGPIGVLVASGVGSLAGWLAATHRVRLETQRRDATPESPARYSDRR